MVQSLEECQPVLVGVGVASQRLDMSDAAFEPLDLMIEAARRAGADSGAANALAGVELISVPRGRWRYRDPGRAIAQATGATHARSLLSTLGVLQQTLINDACSRIAAGELQSVLVVGGDAGHRILRAKKAGQRATERQQDSTPDETLAAAEDLLHPAEIAAGIRLPAALYAVMASAWRHAHGTSVAAHRSVTAQLYAAFSRVAHDNPHAWQQRIWTAAEVAEDSERNPMQAFPYARAHCASWNVDQAGALLLCSVARARALGIAPDRWIYPWAGSESNHVVPVSARAEPGRCLAAQLAGRAVLEAAQLQPGAVDLVDLYSCFPIAVEMVAEAIGLPLDLERPPTLTGGMSFAGGPFNNYVLQATCRMAERMRAGDGQTALVSCVSGVLNKVGFGLWGRQPASHPYQAHDVSAAVAAHSAERVVDSEAVGAARVVGHTVVYEREQLPRVLILAETAAGKRALAWSSAPGQVAKFEREDVCGAPVLLQSGTFTTA